MSVISYFGFIYIIDLIILIFLQNQGNRIYLMGNKDEVKLQKETVKNLQRCNAERPSIFYDAKYLKELAVDVFGVKSLSQYAQHGLDPMKLDFVRGKNK